MVTYRYIDFAKHIDPFYGVFEGDVLWSGNDNGALVKLTLIPINRIADLDKLEYHTIKFNLLRDGQLRITSSGRQI